MKKVTEHDAIQKLVNIWNSVDLEACDYSTMENAITAAKYNVKKNPKWSNLRSYIDDIENALNAFISSDETKTKGNKDGN